MKIKETSFISKEMKKRLLLLVNVILLVALLAIATYSWFSRNTIDTVDVDQIAFDGSSDLEVSLTNNENDFGYSRTLSADTSSLSKEITGDGIPSNFHRASTTSDTSNSSVLVPNGTREAEPEDYIVQDIYFRSKEDLTVYLSDGSYVKGAAELRDGVLVGDNVINESSVTGVKNKNGNSVKISKDCIVGATRIAFLQEDSRILTWIPRANLFYNTKTDGTKTIYGGTGYNLGNLNSDVGTGHPYPDPTIHYYYDDDKKTLTDKVTAGKDNLSSSSVGKNDSCLVKLTKTDDQPYFTGHIKVVIWVEGCDAEARRAFAGGKFGVRMQFVGITSSN